ncbi:restriction endonuclease subunit S [Patescibacteria group bacterium]|nr:restriction endonuclease subunit S [Patescibacteria group bacterium]MBU1672860.1 restriction endonuclease subunit S [Patescibacteria group bacterium]MBU1901587.1 restriction endonuclease subunit S [Patescibacteria group bacterium]
MKNNEIELPAGWKMVELKTVCKTTSGGTPSRNNKEFYKNGKISWVKSGELKENIIFETEEKITKDALKSSNVKILPKGTFLMAMYGANIGQTAELGIEATTNQAVCAFFPDESKILKDFLKIYLINEKDNLIDKGFGGAQSNISQTIIKDLRIPLPPIPNQKEILMKLNESKSILTKSTSLLFEAEIRLANVMSSALHKLIPDDESVLPEGWEMVELQDIAEINPKKSEVKDISDDTDVSFVPMAAVNEHTGKIETPEIRKIGKVRKGYTYFKNGDVLFAKITPCMENGKSAIANNLVNGIGFGTTEFHVIRPSDRLNAKFIYSILRSDYFRHIAQQHMTGTAGQARVPTDYIKTYQIALPPIEEQEKIVDRLTMIKSKVNEARNIYKEAKSRTDKIQQSLFRKAFRGELVK